MYNRIIQVLLLMMSSIVIILVAREKQANHAQSVMSSANDLYEDIVVGVPIPIIEGKTDHYYLGTQQDARLLEGGDPTFLSTVTVVDQYNLLAQLEGTEAGYGNLVIMGHLETDGTFTACAAWPLRAVVTKAAIAPKYECFKQK